MPTRPPLFVPPGHHPPYRDEHERKRAYDKTRPGGRQRGYDETWARLRNCLVEVWPVCSVPGCSAATAEIDHVVSVRERPDLRLEIRNLRPMCRHHHSQRTAREQGFARSTHGGSVR